MTDEAKKLVAEYMDWTPLILNNKAQVMIDDVRDVYFDLNDAGLCVEEMVKRGDWEGFVAFVEETPENRESLITWNQLIAWLFSADNFVTAFAEWRKGK